MNNNLVVMDNNLIRASYKLTVNEMRLILVALSQMPKDEPIDPNKAYYITKHDFVRFGVEAKNVAREIREACNDLMNRTVVIDTPLGDLHVHWVLNILHFKSEVFERLKAQYPTSKNDEDFISQLRMHNLLDSLPIISKSDDNIIARVVFHPNMMPYISQLKKQFTKLNIADFFTFGSFYSFRVYMMIMQFKETGLCRITLDEFRNSLDLNNKYPLFADVKRWVIDTAVKEINEKTSYKINCELLKTGRKFTHLEFKFSPKEEVKKTKNNRIERDIDTIDLFYEMTDAQVAMYSSKLSRLPEFSYLAESGESYEILAFKISKMLKDTEQRTVFSKALKEMGFKK